MGYPKTIQNLIDEFSKMPGIGPRQAARCVFYLLSRNKTTLDDFGASLKTLKESIGQCERCFAVFEDKRNENAGKITILCPICSNTGRNKKNLCIVENEITMYAIERTGAFHGTYFILGGTIRFPEKDEVPLDRVEILAKKIRSYEITPEEIILATDENLPGQATALYLRKELTPFGIKITRLGRGLPTGGELEYADAGTLQSALEGRR